MQEDVSTVGQTLSEDPQPSSARNLLLVVMEQRSLARYALGAQPLLRIGRAEDCDILLRDPLASRCHAVLHLGAQLELEDTGSRNGTSVRNERLSPGDRVRITPGDLIQIGGAVLVVQVAPRARASGADTEGQIPLERGVILRDPAMREVYALVQQFAPGSISVLILGETGVGKEVIAERIHQESGARSRGPFVRINCAALTESLFESELFGHERGSFTGASRAKLGLLEAAHTGTAFLDEIAELPLSAQAKLLRALESREITRVGSVKPQAIDVRFMSATNRDLRAEVARGRFREDLFFRLAGGAIAIPPLRQRPSELEPLVNEFLAAVSAQLGRPVPRISAAVLHRLRRYDWPGNIRELRNVIECASLRASGEDIELADLPAELLEPRAPQVLAAENGNHSSSTLPPPLQPIANLALSQRQEEERDSIISALNACHGNQTRAAQLLGMPRRTLVAKLSVYALPRPRKPTS